LGCERGPTAGPGRFLGYGSRMGTQQSAQRIFTMLIILSLVLLGLIIRPLAQSLFFAAVLTGALYPLYERLSKKVGGRPNLAASILCASVVLALLMPVGGIAAFVIKETVHGVRLITETVRSEGVTGLIEHLPESLQGTAQGLLEHLPTDSEEELNQLLQKQASAQSGEAARAVTGALAATGTILFQSGMMLIALFFLLVDGKRLVAWIEQVSPLERGQATELMIEFRKVSVAVLVSTLATAGLQALAAFVGYLIARVPHPFFFATLTFFVAFVPAFGAGGAVLAVAILILALGHPWAALFLALWGFFVVGMVDNIVKPLLVKRGMNMHGGIVFFALLGGLAAFGSVGLIAGPLVVSFFLALVRIQQRDFGNPAAAASTQPN
jgi:predicted PurR-regulated permease PerM